MKPLFCPNFNLIVWRHNRLNQTEMTRLRCKSWQCDYCAALNREMWRSHLKKRISRLGGRWWFITTTSHEGNRSKSGSLQNLRRGLDLLFKRIRKVFGKVEYVRVYEAHQTGAFHAHIIMGGLSSRVAYRRTRSGKRAFEPVEQKGKQVWSLRTWLKKMARTCRMGYMVDVQELSGVQKTVNYICKYVTKEAQNFHVKHLRRIQTSQGIGAANERSKGGQWHIAGYVYGADCQGRDLIDLNYKMTIHPSYWHTNYTYPPSAQA